MKQSKYWFIAVLAAVGIAVSCEVDDSKFPLPYNDRTTGAYARLYQVKSSTFLGGLTTDPLAAFEAIFEPVDEGNGDDTDSIVFFVSHRRGTGLSREVFVKSVPVAGNAAFQKPAAPTYSVYKRGKIVITQAELEAALAPFAGIDPDGPATATGNFLAAYPGLPTNVSDQFVIRWVQVLKDGRRFTTLNPQTNVNPLWGNRAEENGTPNITTGQFYSSPFIFTMTVRQLTTATNPTSYTGTFNLRMAYNWSPAHTNAAGLAMHSTSYPEYMNTLDFPDQQVTLSVPTGGLLSEREFQVQYRGQTVTMRVNLEPINPNLNAASLTSMAASSALDATGMPAGLGLSGGPFTNANLGTVFLPLMNTGVDCTPGVREFYWVTPAAGSFGSSGAANSAAVNTATYRRFDPDLTGPLPATRPGLPAFVTPNRGLYRRDDNGTDPGDWITIGVDDDADEYGRRNGYCSWTRRIYLVLTHI